MDRAAAIHAWPHDAAFQARLAGRYQATPSPPVMVALIPLDLSLASRTRVCAHPREMTTRTPAMTDHQSPLPNRKAYRCHTARSPQACNGNRSAATNDPLIGRANGNTARGRRVRDLYRTLIGRLGDADVIAQAEVLEVAELIVACEDIRAQQAEAKQDGQKDRRP
jgi:hypothetical protein